MGCILSLRADLFYHSVKAESRRMTVLSIGMASEVVYQNLALRSLAFNGNNNNTIEAGLTTIQCEMA